MIAELLVAYTCINSKGCQETATAYYVTHPELKQFVQTSEENLKRYLDPVVVNHFGPMIYYIMGGTAVLHINDSFNLQFNKQNSMLIFHREF